MLLEHFILEEFLELLLEFLEIFSFFLLDLVFCFESHFLRVLMDLDLLFTILKLNVLLLADLLLFFELDGKI